MAMVGIDPRGTFELFGVRLVGVSPETGKKVLLTLAFVALAIGIARLLPWISGLLLRDEHAKGRVAFWTRQVIHLTMAVVVVVGVVSVWFDQPARLASAAGLVTAGLAFALQRVITAVAGYFVILRGKMFNVGDRIVMGGVRGDVIALGFIQTTIMEMGQTPSEQGDAPSQWVKARQYTGRVVAVSNAKIFDEPVYNYTREFPYVWEEMTVPIPYRVDRGRAEAVLLEAAGRHSVDVSTVGKEAIAEMERRFALPRVEMGPRVYWRLTDNWLELTVRFIVEDRGIRDVKDAMSRDILKAFGEASIDVASATYEIVGVPEMRVRLAGDGGRLTR